MPEWELTEEEIDTAVKEAYNPDDKPEYPILIFHIVSMQRRAVAKAAQKKLVLWLEANIVSLEDEADRKDWQELRKGVGLE